MHSHGHHLGGEIIPRSRRYLGMPLPALDRDERHDQHLLAIGVLDVLDQSLEKTRGEREGRAHGSSQEFRPPTEALYPAQAVLGPVELEALGKTSSHEHMMCDIVDAWLCEPAHDHDRDLTDLPITLENLGKLRRDPLASRPNLKMDELDAVTEEVRQWKLAGGDTIVDCTNGDIGRDPRALRHISQETQLNIVMGSGFYTEAEHPPDMDSRTLEQCAAEIIKDVTTGVGDTGIRSGLIGETACSSDRITKNEEKALRACALAQQETGAPISIHPPIPFEKQALKVLDILEEEGADIPHVLICHMDFTLDDPAYHKAIAERGCMVEFDRFGNEWYFDSYNAFEWRDINRLQAIKWLIDNGHEDQIVIGHDICFKVNWTKYGGWGYGHILRRVVPLFDQVGIDERLARKLLVENPRQWLAFRKPLPSEKPVD